MRKTSGIFRDDPMMPWTAGFRVGRRRRNRRTEMNFRHVEEQPSSSNERLRNVVSRASWPACGFDGAGAGQQIIRAISARGSSFRLLEHFQDMRRHDDVLGQYDTHRPALPEGADARLRLRLPGTSREPPNRDEVPDRPLIIDDQQTKTSNFLVCTIDRFELFETTSTTVGTRKGLTRERWAPEVETVVDIAGHGNDRPARSGRRSLTEVCTLPSTCGE